MSTPKKKRLSKPRATKPSKEASASPVAALTALATAPVPSPAASPPPEYVRVGSAYRLEVDPSRAGYLRLMPAWPGPEEAPKSDYWHVCSQTVVVRAVAPFDLKRYRSEGHVRVFPGEIVQVYCNRPDELTPLRDKGVVELMPKPEDVVPVFGLRPASYIDPADDPDPVAHLKRLRGRRFLSVDDREAR